MSDPHGFVRDAVEKLASDEHAGLRKDLSIFVDFWGLDAYDPPERVEMRVREIVKGFVTAAQILAREHAGTKEAD